MAAVRGEGDAVTGRELAARALCVAFAVLVAADAVLATLIYTDSSYHPDQSLASGAPDVVLALSWAAVGAILTVKRPDNLVGWSIALAGGGMLVGGLFGGYGELALLAKPELGLPGGAAAGAIDDGSWTPLMAGVVLLLVLFPAGRLPSGRWRRILKLVLAGFGLIWVVIATSPGHLDPPLDAYTSPLAVTGNDAYLIAIFPVIAFCLVCTALAGISLVLRYRRSRGQERQQFKWLAASAALLVATLPLAAVFDFSGWGGNPFGLALIALPVSVGIAVLRYRLYEIDVIVRRTVVYGVLTGALAGLYFAIVLALQQAFSSLAGGSSLAIALSTLAVAALFRPARTRIQAFVDRRFYRRKYDAEQTVAMFAARLRDEVDLDALRGELTAVVAETMQPAHVSLWLREAR
jgi:hypothetical protein